MKNTAKLLRVLDSQLNIGWFSAIYMHLDILFLDEAVNVMPLEI